jgi:hypothetical protein
MELETIDTELSRLDRQCKAKNVDVRPWVSNDHPLSLEHWGLVQRRLRLLCPGRHGGRASDPNRPKRTLSPAQLAAMKAGRQARAAGAVLGAFSDCQSLVERC